MALIYDMETEPLAREIIEATLPDSLRNPVMPEEIANPVKPDFAEKCPDYGFKKASDALAKFPANDTSEKCAKATADYATATAKRDEWNAAKEKAWIADCEQSRANWKAKIESQRNKAFADAALDAKTGRAKLIVLRDTLNSETVILVFETDNDKIDLLTAPDAFKGNVEVVICATEAGLLKRFFAELHARMDAEEALEDSASCVGYYIKDFDFPFAYRRAWMNGVPQVPLFRRGRYWSEEIVDLHELFSFGERQYKVGGLDGLAEALGCKAAKLGDGAGFADWYQRNPVEGVQYCLNDVALTEEAARKMGVVK